MGLAIMKKWSRYKKGMIIFAIVTTILTVLFFISYNKAGYGILNILAITFLTTAFHFDIRLLVGNIIPKFKNKTNINSGYFKLRKSEEVVYKKIRVKNWKTKTPIIWKLNKKR